MTGGPRIHRPGRHDRRALVAARARSAAALLFASSAALGQSIRFAHRPASSATSWAALPGQFCDTCPYVVTIIVLAGVVGRSIPPAADGQPVRARSNDLTRATTRRASDRARRTRDVPRPRRRDAGRSRLGDDGGIEGRWSARADRGRRRVVAGRTGRHSGSSSTSWPRLRLRPGQPERGRRSTACRRSRRCEAAAAATGPFDIVDVFRRARELGVPHAKRPSRSARAPLAPARRSSTGRRAAIAASAGLVVVMDRCTAIEHAGCDGRVAAAPLLSGRQRTRTQEHSTKPTMPTAIADPGLAPQDLHRDRRAGRRRCRASRRATPRSARRSRPAP